MEYKPHAYQEKAINFIVSHPIAALFIDMGLGKTSITLYAIMFLLQKKKVEKVLVIAPLRVAKTTWPAEIEKWDCFHQLKFSLIIGSENKRINALNQEADIYIINRENIPWLLQNGSWFWDMVVIDELQSFKNYKSKRWKALMCVREKINRIVGLTGTPVSNGLMDLFGEIKILDFGKRLGKRIYEYRDTYFIPDKRNGPIVYSYQPLPDAEQKIYHKIEDITLSMSALVYLPMPTLIENNYVVCLSSQEMDIYTKMKNEYVLSILGNMDVTAANAAVLTGKLSQLANGAVYSDKGDTITIHKKKIEALEDIIESMSGRPLLVAYWYKHDFEIICKCLEKMKVIYKKIDTEQNIIDWNSGKIQVGLISPGASGLGINLQEGGNTLVWYSLPWSLELYQQTNARLWRMGQKSKSVVIIRLMTEGTIDEHIAEILEKKDNTQRGLFDALKKEVKK